VVDDRVSGKQRGGQRGLVVASRLTVARAFRLAEVESARSVVLEPRIRQGRAPPSLTRPRLCACTHTLTCHARLGTLYVVLEHWCFVRMDIDKYIWGNYENSKVHRHATDSDLNYLASFSHPDFTSSSSSSLSFFRDSVAIARRWKNVNAILLNRQLIFLPMQIQWSCNDESQSRISLGYRAIVTCWNDGTRWNCHRHRQNSRWSSRKRVTTRSNEWKIRLRRYTGSFSIGRNIATTRTGHRISRIKL